ncbi:MAG TPA: alpha/beta hydrolase [Candidatus Goldiibacteriota bacterium]|nr:alpha/beta hydrolase [Candidatus Goldiibacteriota bacterium]
MSDKTGKKPNKVLSLIFAIIGVLIAANIIILSAGAIIRVVYVKAEMAKIKPYAELVDVFDGKMHVFSAGNGKKTIVLLPGMGIGLPSADFGPLMRKLAGKYTVVCVEYFGTGFSTGTQRPRSCENYTEEIRTALKQAGFKPPYTLMPHSISGVYSEYYAAKYPREVEAIICLDCTGTGYYEKMPDSVRKILPVAKFQQAAGTTWLAAAITTDKKKLRGNGYTDKEINDIITFAGFTVNDTLLAQILSSGEAVREAMEKPYPASVPFFKIIAKQTYETPNPQLKMTPQEYQQKHLDRIGKNAKYEVLDGNHFIYSNNIDRIARIADELLK